ncbi:hypothetical protein GLOTRDRAFT_127335 [Gloeophyllum trabeum ATCC 11539]|uniref:Glucose receptor Git3 N-terminal domain-containing protein n=1 Tax=Gloeophyllum trabeum (strain ATCC 11539 / FP-39264 / Madison 617) TaxID=670483 RepID=S7QAK7_GLOTA|nr:uncharacterized protein GLOTRDRAFT_127335 [Gloeophyllum trabeum ATCC 11539]EPQ56951.1 hypothetical protein GLOTRDRAFT_127335 [Gloeophyllum trabeum ATCC 11539]
MNIGSITASGLTTNASLSNDPYGNFSITGFNGTRCWWQDFDNSIYNGSNNPHPPIHCLSSGDQLGLMLDVEAGLISGVAVLLASLLILRNLWRYLSSAERQRVGFIQEAADIYVLLLFFFEIFQALGGITSIEWLRTGIVRSGGYCTAQGILQEFGEMGVAAATLAIALHTFRVLAWGRFTYDHLVAYIVVCVIIVYDALFVGLSTGINASEGKDYILPDPFWCWVGDAYKKQRILGEYLWIWFALVGSIVLYPPLYFLLRGDISFDPNSWYRIRIHRRGKGSADATQGINPLSLRGMLAYPAVYAFTVLPLSVTRWTTFHLKGAASFSPNAALTGGTFFAETLFRLSGVFNVILLLLIRPQLLSFRRAAGAQAPSLDSLDEATGNGGGDPAEHRPSLSERGHSIGMQEMHSGNGRGPPNGLAALEEHGGWDLEHNDDSQSLQGPDGVRS